MTSDPAPDLILLALKGHESKLRYEAADCMKNLSNPEAAHRAAQEMVWVYECAVDKERKRIAEKPVEAPDAE